MRLYCPALRCKPHAECIGQVQRLALDQPPAGSPACLPACLLQRLFSGVGCEELAGEGPHGDRLLSEPAGGIGLQACTLVVTDACMGGSLEAPAVFEAGPPWWRQEVLGGDA
jgi:hypothetical protein